jgi:hypothetical protein
MDGTRARLEFLTPTFIRFKAEPPGLHRLNREERFVGERSGC